ncbi:hypothetical protein CesoFtcFv8_021316 [Champsocephalus esox]|uniref:Uncharacterized protein n=2 Tax=Champsocephalus TaxID=52236 RepID=A0AAN8CT64_CHAGU|nr:hypothetical protein CesoFtcFv8_021316 [Champsocephalus esox]KAK5908815.1 hypothetical protein CgunFtcFv8_016841 [Champsocephalus gunnari]
METKLRLITFSPPRASMSGGHLRIRLPQPTSEQLLGDGQLGQPISAEATARGPSHFSRLRVRVPRPEQRGL